MIRAIRGAAPVAENTAPAISAATQALVEDLQAANGLAAGDIISALFTLTPDLNAAFPAAAARAAGWTGVPMMCAQEIPVPDAMPRLVRVMIHADVDGPVHHIYHGEAATLRLDWTGGAAAQ